MTEQQNEAMKKMANRMIKGFNAVHDRDYEKGKEELEPLMPMFHSEDSPNVKLLAYISIAQLGTKDIDAFLATYEELNKFDPEKEEDKKLKKRVDEMFETLMESLNDENNAY
ncbi:hypothetical protein [Salisediminibacterium halotolerans]|uniref:HEAT repeat-containing protein n=1 Tax=Salisediminibacterium halotolerans TaxID=517425 RepID=A0A1H9VEN1_9BACI|nr:MULTISPECIES: hypothetical protein [Salisediminibacterium]RLJ74451.1 hypothetical protein BCL39_1741 [Actinophytocola xinjiangensis]RPE87456.1 hypothetical protein EDD67_1190 [Salisediminibacterium halotolerans]TWG35287.1 hypothetical protein BCL52_1738 [Salisediminibacterium halotolerans]SES20038.1 hypothetical protein SAMN05444126_12019 [Salisediminibacterium haloalkalitolerans]GEL06769.1 hypothetical protein SHA02_01850 [Salisediminibacterium halotolerans]